MANIANWVAETCSTTGTGDLLLTGSIDQKEAVTFAASLPAGTVWYSIQDGVNREAGIGTFDGASTITRDEIHATKQGNTYNDTSPTPLSLSGQAVIGCTFNSQAFRDLEKGFQVNVKSFGAVGNGSTDDAAAILAADAAGDFTFSAGTYRVSSNISLSSRLSFADGSILLPDSGVTITINGLITAPKGYGTFVGGAGTVDIIDVTVFVPANFPTIQDAVDNCPKVLWQTYSIRLSAGTYAEDVFIEGIESARINRSSSDGIRARLLIRGNAGISQDPAVRVKSIVALNCSGANNNPTLFQFTVYGDNGQIPGPPAAYAAYQCGETEVNDMSFDGDGVLYCLNSYSSRMTVINTDFGSSVNQYAVVTKHLGSVLMQSGNSGVLTDYAYRPEAGIIQCNEASSLRGLMGLVERAQDTNGIDGMVFDTGSQQIWGANSFGEPTGSTFRTYFESLDGYTQQLTGTGTISFAVGGLYLQTGTTSGSTSQLFMERTVTLETTDAWESVPRQFGIGLLQDNLTNSEWFAVMGDLATNYIGFKRNDSGLFAVVNNGTSETALLLNASPPVGQSLWVKTYTPVGGSPYVDFYVGSNFEGQITTGLPTGSTGATTRFMVQIETTDTVNKTLRLGELMISKAF